MKTKWSFILAFCFIAHAAESAVDSSATAQTQSLLAYLKNTAAVKKMLFGHQADFGESVTGNASNGDVYNGTGYYPGVAGVPMSTNVGSMISAAQTAYSRGVITTVEDHMPNLVTGGAFNDTSNTSIASVLPGGSNNSKLNQRLDLFAQFANGATMPNGTRIPIIYRPWHENSGNWFWWGTSGSTRDQFIQLWQYTVTYLRDKKGVHNVLYAYSPNGHFTSTSQYLDRWPGDAFVDIVGFDIYHDRPQSTNDAWFGQFITDAAVATQVARDKGKVAAATEVGPRWDGSNGLALSGNNVPTWYTTMADRISSASNVNLAYMMVWRNQSFSTGSYHFWVPYAAFGSYGDHQMLNDFRNFRARDSVVFSGEAGASNNDYYGSASSSSSNSTSAGNSSSSSSSAASGSINLAQGKPVYATSVESSQYAASNAVDENTSTRWASAWSDEQSLYVDLGSNRTINSVQLVWEAAYARKYQIQVSNDGSTWTTVYTNENGVGGVENAGLGTVNARFVKIYAWQRATAYGYSLYEFKVFGPADDQNIALNRPSWATTAESTSTPASNAFDGVGTTRWSSAFSDIQAIQVDLGSARTVRQVQLVWEAAFARKYQIQISNDGATWTTVYTNENGAGGTENIGLNAVSARYVKLYAWQRATAYGYSLWEFKVFGG